MRSNLPKCGRKFRHCRVNVDTATYSGAGLQLACKVILPEGQREYVTVWGVVTGVHTRIGRGGGNFLLSLNHGDKIYTP